MDEALKKNRCASSHPRNRTFLHRCFMPNRLAMVALSLSLAAAASVSAQDRPPAAKPADTRPSYKRCLDASGGVTPSMQDCIDAEHAYQDRRLNQTYRALMKRLAEPEAARLRERQRAWIRQRDRDCDPGRLPGQGQALDADSCLLRQTAGRAAQLQAQLGRTR